MTGRPRRSDSEDVFLNFPFDSKYESLFLALIAGTVGHGLNPRSVLEIPATKDRLDRILELIQGCRYSIHDLSRVQQSRRSGFLVPRFNMPFEAGLAISIAMCSSPKRKHDWYILEEKPHRLEISLNDLNGYDPYVHRGTPEGVLEAVMNIFSPLPVDTDELERLSTGLLAMRVDLKGKFKSIFGRRPFNNLRELAWEIHRKSGNS